METSLTIDYDTQWLNCVYMHVPDISHNMNGGGGAIFVYSITYGPEQLEI